MPKQLPQKTVKQIDHSAAGVAVRSLRERAPVSLRWLADKMGITPSFLSDLERGRRNWTEARFKRAVVIILKQAKTKGSK